MASFLHFLESIKFFLFLFGICVFDITTKSEIKIKTRPLHVVLIITMIFANIFGLFTAIKIDNLRNHQLFHHGLSGTMLFLLALVMAGSSLLLLLFSLANRKNQILLLRKIDAFDRRMHECVTFRTDCRKRGATFVSHMFVFILYEVVLFVTQVVLKYFGDTSLILFFAFYAVSDVKFSAHILHVIVYGRYLIHRYGTLNKHLKIILSAKRQPVCKRFSMLMSFYEQVFQLQLLVMKCFGSILLFTVMFHMVAITVSVYVFINDISTDFDRFYYYLVTFITWMLPYFVRIFYIASTFATVTSQVRFGNFNCKRLLLIAKFGVYHELISPIT